MKSLAIQTVLARGRSGSVQTWRSLLCQLLRVCASVARRPPSTPRRPIFIEPAGIVTRPSTEVLAIEGRYIAAAVRFIREHASEGIDASDILRAVPLSRSTLERRFARALGRSPKGEILRIRLNRAKELLAQTDFALARVAEKVGFQHTEYLSEIFKRRPD